MGFPEKKRDVLTLVMASVCVLVIVVAIAAAWYEVVFAVCVYLTAYFYIVGKMDDWDAERKGEYDPEDYWRWDW